jgi:hypothetical protein
MCSPPAGRQHLPPGAVFFYAVYFGMGVGFYVSQVPASLVAGAPPLPGAGGHPGAAQYPHAAACPRRKEGCFRLSARPVCLHHTLGGEVPREEHPFTISSSPADREAITFTIKALGDFTSTLGKLETDSPVRVDAPYGVFSYRNHSPEQPLGMIAGGIGITPILSMLRTLRAEGVGAGDRFLVGGQPGRRAVLPG